MSDPVRVGVAVEGPTDRVVLEAILPRILSREVVVTRLQPTDTSLATGHGGDAGFGWKGVLHWCDDVRRHGGLELLLRLRNLDMLVVHLDGDVARDPAIAVARPCPPASDSADALRALLLDRLGLAEAPSKLVLAVPMDATETWLLALFRDAATVDECAQDPARDFRRGEPKLANEQGKVRRRYEAAFRERRWDWSTALSATQAARFDRDVRAATVSRT